MGILRDFEKRLEGAVEGFFARAFRSGLQPVELAKAIQRYAGNYQQVGIDGVFVPNVYRIELSPQDMERFSGFEQSLRHELADVVRRTAADRGWRLQGAVRIELREVDAVPVGTYELRGKAEAGEAERPARAERPKVRVVDEREGAGGHTRLMEAPRTGKAWLHVLNGPASGQRHAVGETTLIGRLPECDVTLDDPSVSRRHARVTRSSDGWSVEDLGSTNGVRVNGEAAERTALRDGDRIELGAMRLAFAEDQ